MKTREQIALNIAGHEIRLEIEQDERAHVEAAARQVTEKIHALSKRLGGGASPIKVATMVAFQFACDLSAANECLDEAEKLHEDLRKQKEAVARLEKLLAKVDDALAV